MQIPAAAANTSAPRSSQWFAGTPISSPEAADGSVTAVRRSGQASTWRRVSVHD